MSPNLIIALTTLALFGLLIAPFVSKVIKLGDISGVAFSAPMLRSIGDVSRTDPKGTRAAD